MFSYIDFSFETDTYINPILAVYSDEGETLLRSFAEPVFCDVYLTRNIRLHFDFIPEVAVRVWRV